MDFSLGVQLVFPTFICRFDISNRWNSLILIENSRIPNIIRATRQEKNPRSDKKLTNRHVHLPTCNRTLDFLHTLILTSPINLFNICWDNLCKLSSKWFDLFRSDKHNLWSRKKTKVKNLNCPVLCMCVCVNMQGGYLQGWKGRTVIW